jgi:hypothetical protein
MIMSLARRSPLRKLLHKLKVCLEVDVIVHVTKNTSRDEDEMMVCCAMIQIYTTKNIETLVIAKNTHKAPLSTTWETSLIYVEAMKDLTK